MNKLLEFYSDEGPERVGLLMKDGSILEVENKSSVPTESFIVDASLLVEHELNLVGMFHTHPGANSNLSGDDYQAFRNWPGLLHYIVGNDGLRCFEVRPNGAIIQKRD